MLLHITQCLCFTAFTAFVSQLVQCFMRLSWQLVLLWWWDSASHG